MSGISPSSMHFETEIDKTDAEMNGSDSHDRVNTAPISPESEESAQTTATTTTMTPAASTATMHITLTDPNHPLGLVDDQQFWKSHAERHHYLRDIQAHDNRIRDFIDLVAAHDVGVRDRHLMGDKSASQAMYNAIIAKLGERYSIKGLDVSLPSCMSLPKNEMLLRQLETEISIAATALDGTIDSKQIKEVRKRALHIQTRFFLYAACVVVLSLLRLTLGRSRDGLVIDQVDDNLWQRADVLLRRAKEDIAAGCWSLKCRRNHFVGLMATAIRLKYRTELPIGTPGLECLQAYELRVLIIRLDLLEDANPKRSVQGISIQEDSCNMINSVLGVVADCFKDNISHTLALARAAKEEADEAQSQDGQFDDLDRELEELLGPSHVQVTHCDTVWVGHADDMSLSTQNSIAGPADDLDALQTASDLFVDEDHLGIPPEDPMTTSEDSISTKPAPVIVHSTQALHECMLDFIQFPEDDDQVAGDRESHTVQVTDNHEAMLPEVESNWIDRLGYSFGDPERADRDGLIPFHDLAYEDAACLVTGSRLGSLFPGDDDNMDQVIEMPLVDGPFE